MALKYKVDKLDDIDDSLHTLYTKTDDGYILGVDGVEDVTGLKKALDAERLLNKENKSKLTALESARDKANTTALEEQGKYKELYEKQQSQTTEFEGKFNTLTAEIAKGKSANIVKDLALSMTTDVNEIDVISRFALDYINVEGKEATFSKPIEELKTELSRFVASKAQGSGDKGNNKGSGNTTTMERSEFSKLDTASQSKFMNDGGSLTD